MKKDNSKSIIEKTTGRKRTIALLGRDLVFEIPIAIFRVIRELAKRERFRLLYFSGETYKMPFTFDKQANILYDLISPQIADGIIVISNLLNFSAPSREFRERCLEFHPLPVVSLGIAFEGIPSVVLDNASGIYDAVSHLIEVHRLTRIAFLSGLEGHPDASERFSSFTRAMETHGLPVEKSLLFEGNYQEDSGTAAVRELMDVRGKIPGEDVQAIVCCNDYMAAGVMLELQRRDIRIPDEIALVGFDNIGFSDSLNPGLSTVHQAFDTMAAKATEFLLSLLEGRTVPEVVKISSRFIPRGSCGCPDTLDHTENLRMPEVLEKKLRAPEKFSAHVNSQIVNSVKSALILWKHAISHLWREYKWIKITEADDSSLSCSEGAWGLLARLAYSTFNSDNYQNMIYHIGSALTSTLELPELVNILTRMLPEAGITRCCICLYENPEKANLALPALSRLVLAFSETGPQEIPQGGLSFATREFLPAEIARKQGWKSWVVLPLFFKEEQLGYVLMDSDAPHENIHWNLRNQISSALKGARLLDEAQRANNLLLQANEQKTQFFINVAHETKTPLTLIQNYMALYMEQHESDEKLLVIKENIDLLLSHMLNFLDAERLQKGETIYRHDAFVDLSEAARRKCELFRAIAARKKIGVTVNAEDRVVIKIDPRALDRIFNNLLDNAVKYIQNGGRISIAVLRYEGRAMLRICDNGPGLPADASEHMFEPYYLLSKKKSGQQGIGVGLSIVKKIVDDLGASIALEKTGEGGRGACFTISFALSGVAAENKTIAEISSGVPVPHYEREHIEETNIKADKHSILVVDDNIQLLKFIQASFSEPYNVYLARNSAEALVKLRIMPRPDVIVSDVMMDGADGFDLLSTLSAEEGYNDIPFIFLTALGGEKETLRGLDLGAVDYIEKPFSIAILRAKIESIIALRDRQEKQERERIRGKIDGLLSGSKGSAGESLNSEFAVICKKYKIAGREIDIIKMLGKRLANKEIASLMSITQRAVEYHITKIFKKCGVNNKFDLLNKFQL